MRLNKKKNNLVALLSKCFFLFIVLGLLFSPLQVTIAPSNHSDSSKVVVIGKTIAKAEITLQDQTNCVNFHDQAACKKIQDERAKGAANDGIGCLNGIDANGGAANTFAICVSNIVYYIMVGVFSSIAYICAFFFDLAVQLSLNSTTYALNFITNSWTIVRDLANMAFIFILIYIALKVMLNAEESGTIKSLAIVVVVALLVNFSFFFSRVVIDAGNLLAVQFYNVIPGDSIGASASSGKLTSNLNNASGGATNPKQTSVNPIGAKLTSLASAGGTKDLTQSIMNGLQVQNILSTDSFKEYAQKKESSALYILISLTTIYIAVGIVFGILAGAFLYAGAKFMMRIVGLWFVIIFSPLALVAMAVPKTHGLFTKWRDHLINFSFYPAVFLFMFFILTRFMLELNAGSGGNFLGGVFSDALFTKDGGVVQDGFINILGAIANVGIRLGFVIAMMYLALSAADILAKYRGDITSPWAKSWAGWLGNVATGGGIGWAGRNTLGRMFPRTFAGNTFDPRNIPGVNRTITPLLGLYKPSTETPNKNYGALPIDFGKDVIGERKKAAEKAAKKKERKEDMLERAAIQEEIEARRAENRQQRAQATGAAGAQAATEPQTPPTPPPGGGGGGTRPARTPDSQPAQNTAPSPAAQNSNAGGNTAVGNLAAQRAIQGLYKQAEAEKAKQREAVQNLYLNNKAENFAQSADNINAAIRQQGDDIKKLVREQGEQLRNATAAVATVAALSQNPKPAAAPTIQVPTYQAPTHAQGTLNDETMDKMKVMLRQVIRKENTRAAEAAAPTRPPEPPATPGGSAMPAPRANNDNGPDLKAAA